MGAAFLYHQIRGVGSTINCSHFLLIWSNLSEVAVPKFPTRKRKTRLQSPIRNVRCPVGVGVLPEKINWGCGAHFSKRLPYLWSKTAIHPSLFVTWPNIRYPAVYDRCGWHGCPKHYLWRTFVDGLTDDDEKVASFWDTYPRQTSYRVQKPYHIYDQNGQNWYLTYDQNGWKTIHFLGMAHSHIAI